LTDPDTKQLLASMETFLVVNQPMPAKPGQPPRRRFVQIRGLDDSVTAGKVHGLKLLEGKWMPPDDPGVQDAPDGKGLPYIRGIIGQGLAAQLGKDLTGKTLKAGDAFELGERTWIVHGVLASAGSTFDSELWAKRANVGEKFGKTNYTTVVLRANGAGGAVKLVDHLKNNFTKAKIAVQTETDYFASLSATNRQFTIAIMFIAGFMAIGGVFGITNTMFAAVAQRAKDIGVLRIVGFSRKQVLLSFLLESVVIALIGGLLGCVVAMLLFDGASATSLVSSGAGGKTVVLRLTVDGTILALGLIFALFMGAIGGLVPSLSAMLVRPLESLR
jgi:ABC-type lipoprotein release transport system permease subunit